MKGLWCGLSLELGGSSVNIVVLMLGMLLSRCIVCGYSVLVEVSGLLYYLR